MNETRQILVLYSGGADSVLMMDWALELEKKNRAFETGTLMFDYGQNHKKELVYADNMLAYQLRDRPKNAQGKHETLDISGAFAKHYSNLLAHDRVTRNYKGVHEAHVPGRNGVFVTIAQGYAESHGYNEIWIGCDYSDRINLFPDCYQEWIMRINAAVEIGGSRKIIVKAPLLGLYKEDVIDMLKARGYDMEKIHSGYAEPQK